MAAESKRCCACGDVKPLIDFHRSEKRGGGSARCKPCGIEYARAWYQANKDRKRAYDARRREEKRDLYRAASKRFRSRHPGRKNADTQTRRAAMRGAVPLWADMAAITAIYEQARAVTNATGIRHVVDHDIPLRGRAVCGLHVETNLRVIPEVVNLRKSNHFSITHGGRR